MKRRRGRYSFGPRHQKPKASGQARRKSRSKGQSAAPAFDDDIEEQLWRQRQRQAAEGNSETNSKPREILGNFRYDPERDAYFPSDSFAKQADDVGGGDDDAAADLDQTEQDTRFVACKSPLLALKVAVVPTPEFCFSARQRVLIRSAWAGRIVRNRMQVMPTFIQTAPKGDTLSFLPPLRHSLDHSGYENPWALASNPLESSIPYDLGCKFSLHASARTMDVHMGSDRTKMPSIATLVNGGCSIRTPHQPRLWKALSDELDEHQVTLSHVTGEKSPHAIRFCPQRSQERSSLCFATASLKWKGKVNVCRVWRTSNSRRDMQYIEGTSEVGINDLAFHPQFSRNAPQIVLAVDFSRSSLAASRFGPKMFDLSRRTMLSMAVFGQFPKSDILCTEFFGQNSTALFGHRNGAVSFVDYRSGYGTVLRDSSRSAQGSISRLKVLRENAGDSHLILAQYSTGRCALFDSRRMTSIRQTNPLVWNLEIGTAISDSSRCTGLAFDPFETICISPFASYAREPCLGFWSLKSGSYLGHRELIDAVGERNHVLATGTGRLAICEISDTITPAWHMRQDTKGSPSIVEDDKGWGLWCKCASLPRERPVSLESISSIHHVTFPGSFDTI